MFRFRRIWNGVLLVLLLSLEGRLVADYQATVLSQAPAGYWRLNETGPPPPQPVMATNLGSLGPLLNGPLQNGVIRGEPGLLTGTSDTSERFSNPTWSIFTVGSYVNVPYTPALNPSGPFTVEFWAKPTSTPNDVFSTVCSLDTSTNSGNSREGYVFYIDGPNSGWQFRMGNYNGYAAAAAGGSFTPNQWSYVVGSFTGSSLLLYVNGEQVAITNFNGADFTPNTTAHFHIGMTTFPNRTFDGWIEEVAFYTNVLDASVIKAHFDAATTNGPGYAAQVLTENPIGYWRLGEPPDPLAENLGTMKAVATGSYIAPCTPGTPGPSSPEFSGFEPANAALGLGGPSGLGGYVSVPAPNFNTNTITMTGWVKAAGPQVPSAALVFDRWVATGAGLTIDVAGGYGLSYNWNNDPTTYNWASGLALPDADWAFVALVVQPSQASLFVAQDTNYPTFSGATNFVSHPVQAFDGPVLFGGDLAFTDRYFVGGLDEIAIFKRALSVGEVYTLYASAVDGVPPRIFGGPQAPTNQLFSGDSLVLVADTGGSPALSYQWRKDGAAIADATSSQYANSKLGATDSGSYDLVVSNQFGFAVSSPAVIQVNSESVPAISQDPVGRALYPGGTVSLSVVASGGTLDYQWEKDGQPIPGATNSSYVVLAATPGDSGAYRVTATNSRGSSTSAAATVNVLSTATGSFEAAIVGDGPEAWWRMDDAAGASSLSDAMGRHDGVFSGIVGLGSAGAIAGSGGSAASFAGAGYASVPFSPALNPPTFTLECWAKTRNLRDNLCPVSSHFLGKGCYFVTAASGPGQWAGGLGSAGGEYYLPSTVPAATMQPDVWTHLVFTFDPTNLARVFVNGQWDGVSFLDFDHNGTGPFIIGGRGLSSSPAADMFWRGEIDEVAFYSKALTPAQIQAHYAAARYGSNTAPVLVAQPGAQVARWGTALSFRTRVEGTLPINLQWMKDGTAIENATNETLTLTAIDYPDAGAYQLMATNAVGFAQSAPATLVIMPPPVFANLTNGLVLHLKFDNDFADSSGLMHDAVSNGSPVFVPGHIGMGAVQVRTVTAVTNYNFVSIPYSSDFAFAGGDTFSISFWVNYTGLPDDLPMLGNALGSTLNDGWVLCDHKGQLGWTLVDTNGSSVLAKPVGGPALNDGVWHNVVVSFDGVVGEASTFVDGAFVVSRSVAALKSLDPGRSIILGQDPSGTYAVDGSFQIDDLGIWRRALTIYDAQSIYQLGQSSGASFDNYGPVTLAQMPEAKGFRLVWQAGILLEADQVEGPWSPVPGASAPTCTVSPSAGNKFYRIQL